MVFVLKELYEHKYESSGTFFCANGISNFAEDIQWHNYPEVINHVIYRKVEEKKLVEFVRPI